MNSGTVLRYMYSYINRIFANFIYLFLFRVLDNVFNAVSNALRVPSFCLGGGKGFLTYTRVLGKFTGTLGTLFEISVFSFKTRGGDLGSTFSSGGE